MPRFIVWLLGWLVLKSVLLKFVVAVALMSASLSVVAQGGAVSSEADRVRTAINSTDLGRNLQTLQNYYEEVNRQLDMYDVEGTAGNKNLVLFGRTKTDPRRYYYRMAEFVNGAPIWEPWLEVNVQVDADRVYPVFAFDRVFVFWAKMEHTIEGIENATVQSTGPDNNKTVSSDANTIYTVKIYYSFYDLNKEWIPAQALDAVIREDDPISNVKLFVENSDKLVVGDMEDSHENIIINCSYTRGSENHNKAFSLTPELYTRPADKPTFDDNGLELFNLLFNEPEPPTDENDVVMLNTVEKSSEGPWFSFDHKGGSFLCIPTVEALDEDAWPRELIGNEDGLPEWNTIHASFQLPKATAEAPEYTYFFNNADGTYALSEDGVLNAAKSIRSRFGKSRNVISESGQVDAGYMKDGVFYLFRGDKYLSYSNGSMLADSAGEGNLSDFGSLPAAWNQISAAFTGLDSKGYFFNNSSQTYVEDGNTTEYNIADKWGIVTSNNTGRIDVGFEIDQYVYLISGSAFIRYTRGGDFSAPDAGYPKQGDMATILTDLGYTGDTAPYNGIQIIASSDVSGVLHIIGDNDIMYRLDENKVMDDPIAAGDSMNIPDAGFTIELTAGDRWDYFSNNGQLQIYNGTQSISEMHNMPVVFRAAFNGGDGYVYLFSDTDYIRLDETQDYTVIRDAILNWSSSNPQPISGNWLPSTTSDGVNTVDAVLVRGSHTFLFSGDQYFRYTGSQYNTVDAGYPKTIQENDDNLPLAWNQIDAAFEYNNSDYFFNNGTGTLFSSDDLNTEVSTGEVWGITDNHFTRYQAINAAYIKMDEEADESTTRRLFITSGEQFIRYTLSPTGAMSEFMDEGYPKSFEVPGPVRTNMRVNAAFTLDDYAYLIGDNQFIKYRKLEDGGFDTGRVITGKLGALLRDLGFNNSFYWYESFSIRSAYIEGNRFYFTISHYFGTHEYYVSLNNKNSAFPLSYSGPSMKIAYTNASGNVQKTNNSIYDSAFVMEEPDDQRTKVFYLFRGNEFIATTDIPETFNAIVWENPKNIAKDFGMHRIDAAFTLNDHSYLFSGDRYFLLENKQEPDTLNDYKPIIGNWANMPAEIKSGFNAACRTHDELYLVKDYQYVKYAGNSIPYEVTKISYDIIRLTTSTAYKLNQKLFSGGVKALLGLDTQQTDELPSFSTAASSATNIRIREGNIREEGLPVSSHLDFNSANGIYYWEVFFHVPFLIAQSLNTGQKFEESKTWYEYIFDPTEASDFWKFLPFLSVDIQALITSVEAEIAQLRERVPGATINFTPLSDRLADYTDAFTGQRELEGLELVDLKDIHRWDELEAYEVQLNNLCSDNDTEHPAYTFKTELKELLELIKKLPARYELLLTNDAQVRQYQDDPFDPHTIAGLRRIAYRKAVVMNYIDNLLDHGDLLFRQYTRESINEARMLYILAYDLLGKKPESLGTRVLSDAVTYDTLSEHHYEGAGEYDFLFDLENATPRTGDQSLTFAGNVHNTIDDPYFFIPENDLFIDYWNRVEDRLYKIRHCMNIMGVEQPLALFQPPIDPAALVQAASGGGGAAALAGATQFMVPHYRFDFMLRKAQDLVAKLNEFGFDFIIALEKKDAEELSRLQNKQEGVILNMTREVRDAQLREIEQTIAYLKESKAGATKRKKHYEDLKKNGLLPAEKAQIGLMIAGSVAYKASAVIGMAAAIGHVIPDVMIGPFSFGVKTGGEDAGNALSQVAQSVETLGEGLSTAGEVAGIYGQHERMKEDWELQIAIAANEEKQLEIQIKATEYSLKAAQQEARILEKQIEHGETISDYMREKFTNKELYQWVTGKLSGMYFQTYKLAYDMAKYAEKAFQFERGLKESEVNYIGTAHWDSQRKGLLSGDSLGLDLARMEQAYVENNSRRFEITKEISLMELDPMALLQLKTKGVCEFDLSEALFDYDFQGHYCRQVKTISLAFAMGDGKTVMATLSQLNHKTVLEPDAKAVKYLLDPKGDQPLSIRNDWKARQQVALSHTDDYQENNGLFELYFQDERYLPFEGTGAVSRWRLELNGKKGSYDINSLLDVTVKLKYTAEQGGTAFADSVRGMLKPYTAARYFNIADEFRGDWNTFMNGDENELMLTFGPELFPNMGSNKIEGILTAYELEEESPMSIVLNDDEALSLKHGKFLQTSGLSISSKGSLFSFKLKGDKSKLKNLELVMVYQATV